MYTEIVKIVEGGLAGDKEKVSNYAMVLAENLERTGDYALSRRIKSLLTGKRAGLVSLDSFAAKPVDTESRMEMVDVYYPGGISYRPILSPYVEDKIREFVDIYEHRDELLRLGIETTNSLLLYGPPGCGKTTVARYISCLTRLPLLVVRLDGLVSSLLGSTAKNIRKIFDYAARRECILFLDEFDVIAKVRDDRHELGELKRVVNSLLQNIDSFSEDSLLIAATNHHELLDPAVWRRFNNIIHLAKPDAEQVEELIKLFLPPMESNVLTNKKKLRALAHALGEMSHADIKTAITNAKKKAVISKRNTVDSVHILYEVYLNRNHRVVNEEHLIEYMLQHGVVQREISEGLGYSLRKIRDVARSLK